MNEQLDKTLLQQEPAPLDLGLRSILNTITEEKNPGGSQLVELGGAAATTTTGNAFQLAADSVGTPPTGLSPRRSAFEVLAEEGLWEKLGLLCERRVMASGAGDIEAQVWWIKAQLALGAVPVAALTAPLDEISRQLLEVLELDRDEGRPGISGQTGLEGELSIKALRHLVASALVEVADTLEKQRDNSLRSNGLESLVLEFRDRALVLFGDIAVTSATSAQSSGPKSGSGAGTSGVAERHPLATQQGACSGESLIPGEITNPITTANGTSVYLESVRIPLTSVNQGVSSASSPDLHADNLVPLAVGTRSSVDTNSSDGGVTQGLAEFYPPAEAQPGGLNIDDTKGVNKGREGRFHLPRLSLPRLKRRTAKRIARVLFIVSVVLCVPFGALLPKPLFTQSSSYAVRLPIQLKTQVPALYLPDGGRLEVLAHLDAVFYDLEGADGVAAAHPALTGSDSLITSKPSGEADAPPAATSPPIVGRKDRGGGIETGRGGGREQARASRSLERIDTSGPPERELPLADITLEEDRRSAIESERSWEEPSRSPFSPENFPKAQDDNRRSGPGGRLRDSNRRGGGDQRDDGAQGVDLEGVDFESAVQYVVIAPTGIVTKPSYVAPILFMLRKGDTVMAIGTLGDWLRVRSRSGQEGFILAQDAVREKR